MFLGKQQCGVWHAEAQCQLPMGYFLQAFSETQLQRMSSSSGCFLVPSASHSPVSSLGGGACSLSHPQHCVLIKGLIPCPIHIPQPCGLIQDRVPCLIHIPQPCVFIQGLVPCPIHIHSPVSSQRSPKLSELSMGTPLVSLLMLLLVVVLFHEFSGALLSLPLCSRCPSLAEEPPAAQVRRPLLPDDVRGDDGPHRMPARGTSMSHVTWGGVTASKAPLCVFLWLGSREREMGSWGMKKICHCT